MSEPDRFAWRRGYPPTTDPYRWETSFTAGGAVWHRARHTVDRIEARDRFRALTPPATETPE